MDSPTKKKIVENVVGAMLGGEDDANTSGISLDEFAEMQNDAEAVLGGSDPDNCSYKDGYVKRQALYACVTCLKEGEDSGGICYACALKCHDGCELIELYTKRNFRCDCGTGKFHRNCELDDQKKENNTENVYNHNFQGKYCCCERPYPDPDCPPELEEDEMIQCVVCEDWWHGTHLDLPAERLQSEENAEMICGKCLGRDELKFIRRYSLANTCTQTEGGGCKLAVADLTGETGGSFFGESFRSDLCKCDACLARFEAAKCEFLTDTSDTIESYEAASRQQSQQDEQQTNNQINSFMDRLDHRGQIEIAHGMQALKEAMRSMVESAGESGVVTEEHVAVFKRKIEEDLERRKRRRLDSGVPE